MLQSREIVREAVLFMKDEKKSPQVREQGMTYSDYAALPDDGTRYELADGVLEAMSPSAAPRHQIISSALDSILKSTCKSEYLILVAPLDVILSEKEVRQPDIVMIHRNRLSILSKRGVEGAPDLVVEILSPSSMKRDKVSKLRVYAQYGIPEYWIVDVTGSVLEQYLIREGRYELTDVYTEDEPVRSPQLTCVHFTMNQIVAEIPDLPNL
jgi:Uma2 family endonuclease